MKTIKSTLLVAFMALFSAYSCAQSSKTTEKNRVLSRTFQVSNFTAINSETVGNIQITQSPNHSLRAEGDAILVENLEASVKNGKLILKTKDERLFKKRRNRNSKLTIYISMPQLQLVERDGVGNILIKGIMNAPSITISNEGVGNIEAENLISNSVKITSEGVGNIKLAGKCETLSIESEGVGNVRTERLLAKKATVQCEGVGNVHFYASEAMKIEAEGIGNVVYYGNPPIKNIDKEGLGKVKAAK